MDGGGGSSARPAGLLGVNFVSAVGAIAGGNKALCAELGVGNAELGVDNVELGLGTIELGSDPLGLIRRIPTDRTAGTLFNPDTVFVTEIGSSANNDIAP